ncbi:hypothetical protein ACTD5D_40500 [Nocardia takedensis]|uniref:hypothetical protein n=1 Tax=Nocardia takedensis TaxID=259390 RepID=UPI003F758570
MTAIAQKLSAQDAAESAQRYRCLAQRYRREHDLEVRVAAHDHRILLRTGTVTAVQMVGDVGELVWKALSENGLCTPVIVNDDTGCWTMLTGPAADGPVRVERDPAIDHTYTPCALTVGLDRSSVIRSITGAEIALPGPDDPVRRWFSPPTGPVCVGRGWASYASVRKLARAGAETVRRAPKHVPDTGPEVVTRAVEPGGAVPRSSDRLWRGLGGHSPTGAARPAHAVAAAASPAMSREGY